MLAPVLILRYVAHLSSPPSPSRAGELNSYRHIPALERERPTSLLRNLEPLVVILSIYGDMATLEKKVTTPRGEHRACEGRREEGIRDKLRILRDPTEDS